MPQNPGDAIHERSQQIQALSPIDESDNVIDEPSMPLSTFLGLSLFIFFFVVVFLGFLPFMIGRFRDYKRFQMAILLAIVGGALPLTMGLLMNQTGLLTQASVEEVPRNVEIMNVTSSSFRVRWDTSGEQYGALRFGTEASSSALTTTELEIGGLVRSQKHEIHVSKLAAETIYYFEILSGTRWYDNLGKLLSVETLP
jgi:hypothetical protein